MTSSIRELDLAAISGRLPSIKPFGNSECNLSEYDLGVFALGFEERGLAILRHLSSANVRIHNALCIKYATNDEDNRKHEDELVGLLNSIADEWTYLDESLPIFSSTVQMALRNVCDRTRCPRVGFDISVLAKRILLRIFSTLFYSDVELHIWYAEAEKYFPTKSEVEDDIGLLRREDAFGIERGVAMVGASPEHPGENLDGLPDFVVLFPTFKPERCRASLLMVDPGLTHESQEVVWFVGRPHLEKDYWRVKAVRDINFIGGGSRVKEVSTFDYLATLVELESTYKEISGRYHLSICPLGSKLQCIGIGLFHYLHPEARIIYVAPREYNPEQYSYGIRDLWEINFGPTIGVREMLDRVGCIELVEIV